MDVPAGSLVSATLGASDPRGAGIGTRSLGRFFPRQKETFVVLSTGLAADAETPDDSGGNSTSLDGLDNSQGNDLVQLRLVLQPPPGATCLAFDFAFYSEEFPEFVGSSFNDVFLAELGGSSFVITPDNTVTAPLNFAFDSQGQLVSVNTAFGVTPSTESTFDGGTPLLRAVAALGPNAFPNTVELVFTITDLGDSIFDSAVMLDNFEFLFTPSCGSGGLVEVPGVQIVGLVSIGALGAQPNGASLNPVISGDGRFVAFESNAPNLAQALCGDTSGAGLSHVYRRALASQEVLCISRTNPPGDGDSTAPSISHDGNVIAYRSTATNLAPGCADGRPHILVIDVAAGTHTCLTAGADGASDNPAVSADGEVVAFDTLAGTLAPQCSGGSVIHVERLTGTRTCVSPNGAPSSNPAVSGDGRTVVFQSSSAVFGCANGFSNVVQSAQPFGSPTCVTPNANGASGQPDISDDGLAVAFVSLATNLSLVSPELNCSNGIQQVYIRRGGVTRCFSRGFDGQPGNGPSSDPVLSGNGGAIAFATLATNVIAPTPVGPVAAGGAPAVVAQNQNVQQVMRRSTAAINSTLELMSGSAGGTGNGSSSRPSLDFGGSRVAFQSQADNLVSGDANGQSDVLVTNEAPPPPIGRATIFTPATGSIFPLTTPTTITFAWTPVAGATQYGFEFSAPDRQFTNANGAGPDPINGFGGRGGGLLVTGTTFAPLLDLSSIPPGTYNVRVIAFGLPGSTFSDSVGITLGPVPASGPFTPDITSPPGGFPIFPGSFVAFAWTAVPGAPRYRLDFTGPVSGSVPVGTTSLGVDVPLDIPLGSYEVTVTALDGAGQPLGPPSDPVTVVVGGL
jgi:hypothetical protein